jgi:hypothetical protein
MDGWVAVVALRFIFVWTAAEGAVARSIAWVRCARKDFLIEQAPPPRSIKYLPMATHMIIARNVLADEPARETTSTKHHHVERFGCRCHVV